VISDINKPLALSKQVAHSSCTNGMHTTHILHIAPTTINASTIQTYDVVELYTVRVVAKG